MILPRPRRLIHHTPPGSLLKSFAAVALFLVVTAPVYAEDRTPWKEPSLGPLAATGTTIDIENYHCRVDSPRSMTCLNVGRVCVEKRARYEIRSARRFGCALESSKNHPCPPDDPNEKSESIEIGSCWPLRIGGF